MLRHDLLKKTFPLATIFPLAIIHTLSHLPPFFHTQVRQVGEAGTMRTGSKFRNSCLEVLHKNSSSEISDVWVLFQ